MLASLFNKTHLRKYSMASQTKHRQRPLKDIPPNLTNKRLERVKSFPPLDYNSNVYSILNNKVISDWLLITIEDEGTSSESEVTYFFSGWFIRTTYPYLLYTQVDFQVTGAVENPGKKRIPTGTCFYQICF